MSEVTPYEHQGAKTGQIHTGHIFGAIADLLISSFFNLMVSVCIITLSIVFTIMYYT